MDVFGSTAVATFGFSSLDSLKFLASSSTGSGCAVTDFSPSGVITTSCDAVFEVDERLPGPPFTKYFNGKESDLFGLFLNIRTI